MFDSRVGSGADGIQRMDFEPLKVKRPTGLTLLSAGAFLMVLGYSIIALVIISILPRLSDPDVIEAFVNAGVPQWAIDNSRSIMLIGLIQFVVYAASYLYISYGFYYGRESARLVAFVVIISIYASIVLSFFIYLNGTINFPNIVSSVIGLAINTAILWYITQPETVEFFKDIEQGADLEPPFNF